MSKPITWGKRGAILASVSALALGGAITFAGTASADIDENSFTVDAIQASPGTDNATLNPLTIREDDTNDFIDAGETVTFTITLSDGATFAANSQDDATVRLASGPSQVVENGAGDDVTLAAQTATFQIAGAPSAVSDIITVSGLRVDVDDDAGTNVDATLTSTPAPGDEDFDEDNLTKTVINLGTPDNVGQLNRIGGPDRYATSADAFRLVTGNDADTAVIAGGGDFPDALSASYLAGRADTGILLSRPDVLPSDTRQALIDSGVSKVFIVGGTTAVSNAVQQQIQSIRVGNAGNDAGTIQTVRYGGANRYATNQRVNTANDADLALRPAPSDDTRVLIASGEGFADAVAFGPVAYSQENPIVLTQSASLTETARDQIELFNPGMVDIAGGTTSVSDATATSIDQAATNATAGDIERHGGAERTATAAAIATWAQSEFPASFANALNAPSIANGAFYADALSAAPVNATLLSPTLLTANTNGLGDGLTRYLNGLNRNQDDFQVTVFGLTAVMPQAQINRIAAALGNTPTDPAPGA